jgi:hypothetical protein
MAALIEKGVSRTIKLLIARIFVTIQCSASSCPIALMTDSLPRVR